MPELEEMQQRLQVATALRDVLQEIQELTEQIGLASLSNRLEEATATATQLRAQLEAVNELQSEEE